MIRKIKYKNARILSLMGLMICVAARISLGLEIGAFTTSPQIDGTLDDACWQDAALITEFHDVDSLGAAPDDTWAKMGYNDGFVFFAFSCPHPYPQMMKADDAGVAYKVHYDEHVELAISPDAMSQRLLRVQVNPRGITQVTEYNKFGKAHWDYGDFCRVATAITTNGWTLEIAIPWRRVCAPEAFDADKLSLNLVRTLMANKMDQYGVFTGYDTQKKSLSIDKPRNSLSQYAYQLLPVKFKDAPPTLTAPFTVAIIQANVTDYVYQNGKCLYGVVLKLEGFSQESEKVAVYLDDPLDPEAGKNPVLSVTQGASVSPELTAMVECRAFTPRDLKVRAVNEQGETIAERVIPSPAIFDVLQVRLDRDYYTSEPTLHVLYDCRLPAAVAEKAGLRMILADDQQSVTNVTGLAHIGTVPLDIAMLPAGTHKVRVIGTIAGQNAYEKTFDLIKRPPSRLLEVKLDHGGRNLLVNGKPFFPFGVFIHNIAGAEDLPLLAEHGVNTVSPWFVAKRSAEGYQNNMGMNIEFIKKAAWHNIYVLPNLDSLGTSAAGLPGLLELFPADKQELIASQAEQMTAQGMKGKFAMGNSLWRDLPRTDKNRLFDELYHKTIPCYRQAVAELSKYSNVIGYFFYDEPPLSVFDMNVQGKKLYHLIKEVDGYRPAWTLYSSYIPTGAAATDWIDCLGTDPYWVPPVTNPEGIDRRSINFVSRITANNKRRADEANSICWSIPMLENWSGTYKRLPTAEELRCQSYLALIHGAKGLIYFTYPVGTEQAMQSLLRMGNEVKALMPWLLTRDVPQTPTTISAPVQYAVRVNSSDEYVALVANSRPWPVEFTMELSPALLDGKKEIKTFFNEALVKVENGAFSDSLPAFAVNVYCLGKSPAQSDEIKVSIKTAAMKDDWLPEIVHTPDGRPGRRNILPNPSFEDAAVTGVPDYYFCGRKDPYPAWGSPDSPWALDDQTAYHGEKSLRIRVDKLVPERNFFYVAQRIAPKHGAPAKYMFSVYMKADAENTPVAMKYAGSNLPTFKVGREWRRYQCAVTVQPNAPNYTIWVLRPTDENTTVWIDAVQMELGDEVTDFED